MKFETGIAPDYRRIVDVASNRRAEILPIYEHNVCYEVIGALTGTELPRLMAEEVMRGMEIYCDFFRRTGYDVVTFEQCITFALPIKGALLGGKGPIQGGADLLAFPWAKIPDLWYDMAAPNFEALRRHLPENMKAIGGVGNGIFEIAEDLVGLEYLPFLQADDPDAHDDLYKRIGDMHATIWQRFLAEFGDLYCVCRFGDDLGFRSSLLTMPQVVRENIIPQYKRIIDQVHQAGKPFLLHSCGCIFEVMEDLIAIGIDSKHSNEDAIAPFSEWIDRYSDRIGLFGGIDMNVIVSSTPDQVRRIVLEEIPEYYRKANGYAVGTGNSIPDYVPPQNYLALIEAVEELRTGM